MKFTLVLTTGMAVNQTTKLTKFVDGVKTEFKISTPAELCMFMKRIWMKDQNVKSFTQWATELNESGEYDGTFSSDDAIDNMSNGMILNIDGKAVNIYEYFTATFLKK